MPTETVVWFKRDLRSSDHAPLALAANRDAAVGLYIIEPEWLASAEFDSQHLDFILQSLAELRKDLAQRGLPLLVRVGSALTVLSDLRNEFDFSELLSHEETGSGWTYERDKAVLVWTKVHGVQWREFSQHGVIRRLRTRLGWAGQWTEKMTQPLLNAPLRINGANLPIVDLPTLSSLEIPLHSRAIQEGGQGAALTLLRNFTEGGANGYRRSMSSPQLAQSACSRLSPHIAYGTISMRQVYQTTQLAKSSTDEAHLSSELHSFASRLRWHCHFIQKLEDEPQIEFRNFSRVYDGLREPHFNEAYFEAWCAGMTGFPMVDACMRSLKTTGWLNFRMRAMLVSFASQQLWLHWRRTGMFLAQQFLDFEPGIHWSQMQMQSGTTGINTLRVYSATKQLQDQDPKGNFVRFWIPELGTSAYPQPIVNEAAAMKAAKDKLYAIRGLGQARDEANAVQERHGSRKSGLAPTTRKSANSEQKRGKADKRKSAAVVVTPQLDLFS